MAIDTGVINGDCLQVMDAMPPGTVDLCIADPPYNIGINYGDGAMADRLPDAVYIEWTRRWVKAAARLLSEHGTMVVICGQEYAGDHQVALRDAGLHWRNTVTWHETFGVNCRNKFCRTSRPIYYYTKHRKHFTFNREHVTVPSARQLKYNDKRAAAGGKVMDDVWQISRVCGTFGERVEGVPTQLPLELVRRLVLTLSNHGDSVCDPFAGSGTTGVVCAEAGRRFVGIEIRDQFAAIARDRISNTEGVAN